MLLAGCGLTDKDARTTGDGEELGGHARASDEPAPSPSTPPPPRKIDCSQVKCVALTFDDGPGEHTERLLDTLKAGGVRATFFMLGEKVGDHAALVRRMAMEGHELANHTWSHPDLTGLSPAGVRSQIQRTQKAVKDASGVTPTVMRPPYGATNEQVGKAGGMPQILWSVDTNDWRHRNAARNAKAGIDETENGGIVLYHDIHKPSVDCIPQVVDGLKDRGFTFVTVTELFQGQSLRPGEEYTELVTPDLAGGSPPPPGSSAGPSGTPADPSEAPAVQPETPAAPRR